MIPNLEIAAGWLIWLVSTVVSVRFLIRWYKEVHHV